MDTFTTELDEGVYAEYVNTSAAEAIGLGMRGTPSVILNGRLLDGVPQDFEAWNQGVGQLIEFDKAMADLEDRQYDAPPEMSIDTSLDYQATIVLENGDEIVIDLFEDRTPETVNNFVFLAEEGWYDGVTFHRVIPGFMAQTGDPTGIGIGGPGYTIPDEFDPELTHTGPGIVSMANSGPNTGGSQFFITFADATHLDGAHAIFGEVTSGMDQVEGITPRDPADPNAPDGDKIVTINITTVEP